jgi:hypothetical protein
MQRMLIAVTGLQCLQDMLEAAGRLLRAAAAADSIGGSV